MSNIKTLRGFSAPYIPGWDCHGLPIEFKVTQEMRKAGDTSADPATIRKACEAYARKYIDLQRAQFKRLGVLGDWENPYLTLNKEYEADELRLFADIVEKGFVYRGKKPVYWSIPCRTALAEAEVEYQDHVSQSVFREISRRRPAEHIRRHLDHHALDVARQSRRRLQRKTSIRPASVGEENYILFRGLLAGVAEKCGWANYTEEAGSAPKIWPNWNINIRSAIAPANFSPPILSPATPAPVLSISRPAMAWTTTILDAKRPADLFAGG